MTRRLLLIDPDETTRQKLVGRLESLGLHVDVAEDGIAGVGMALENPPHAVIADLWTPGASGIQICRFLKSEPATMDVPVLLRGDESDRRNRYWAERAGAKVLLGKGRVGELLRALTRVLEDAPDGDGFFMHLAPTSDIRDRIARQLDAALFDSVIASEVRALANCDSTERLFDRLTQFVSQVKAYRWLALHVPSAGFFGLHHHPKNGSAVLAEACASLELPEDSSTFKLEDDDTSAAEPCHPPIMRPVRFADGTVARIAMSPMGNDDGLVDVLARELGAPLRVTALVEETRRLAATDALTGVMNRRAFIACHGEATPRSERNRSPALSLALIDIDHFKSVNDTRGHAAGDRVLATVAHAARQVLRRGDVIARWGGEEFVVSLSQTSPSGAALACERLRAAIEGLQIHDEAGERIPVTASVGVATRRGGESLDQLLARADVAMYRAKRDGRNRVVAADSEPESGEGASPSTRPSGKHKTLELALEVA